MFKLFKETKYYDYEVKKLIEYNNKIEKEMGGTYLWDFEEAARRIMYNMQEEAGMNAMYWEQYAYFLALRFKFADEKTIGLVRDALLYNKKNYFEKISDDGYPIYVAMQSGNDYYTAIFMLYRNTDHAKESDLPLKITIPDIRVGEHNKLEYAYPTEDGKKLICYAKDEYHKKFGLTKNEKLNLPPSVEWKAEFDKFNARYSEEFDKYEAKYKKKFKKWNKKEKDEFSEHIENIRKEYNL